MKQIRLLENSARTDSLKVIELSKALNTLNIIVELKNHRIENCNSIIKLQEEKICLQDSLIDINKDKMKLKEIEKRSYKKQIRNRTFLFVASAILNSILIIKSF